MINKTNSYTVIGEVNNQGHNLFCQYISRFNNKTRKHFLKTSISFYFGETLNMNQKYHMSIFRAFMGWQMYNLSETQNIVID